MEIRGSTAIITGGVGGLGSRIARKFAEASANIALADKLSHERAEAVATRTRAFSPRGLDIIEYHQERYDGSGYPNGLRGDLVPEGARIIANAFDALAVHKPYRTTYSLFKALTIVRDEMATGFDRLLLRDFIFSLC